MENRRETIVINKRFQYQTSLLIAALAVLLVNVFLIARMVLPGAAALHLPASYAIAIGLVEFLLVAGIWYASLRATHRIAGPVFVMTREMQRLGKGDLNAAVHLRDTDMFQAEAAQMNASITDLRQRINALQATARELQRMQADGEDITAGLQKLHSELMTLKAGDEA